jgi:hypothetical protein
MPVRTLEQEIIGWRAVADGGRILLAKPEKVKHLRTKRDRRLIFRFVLSKRIAEIAGLPGKTMEFTAEEYIAYAENKVRELTELQSRGAE